MKRRDLLILLGGGAFAPAAQAVDLSFWPFSRRTSRKPLLIAGSSTMFELNQALAQEFSRRYPEIDVVVEKGGSLSALIALKRGSIDVAAMDRDFKASDDLKGLRNYLVARNGVGIVVNKASPITALSSAQVEGLLGGSIVNWAQVGGQKAAVQVVARAQGTPSRQFVEEMVLGGGDVVATTLVCETPQQVIETVARNRHAIGFILLKDKQTHADVRYLQVDGVNDSRLTILSNRYPYTQSLYLAIMGGDAGSPAALFVDFARSTAGQKIVDEHQLVSTY